MTRRNNRDGQISIEDEYVVQAFVGGGGSEVRFGDLQLIQVSQGLVWVRPYYVSTPQNSSEVTSVTEYRVVARTEEATLVSLAPQTGRQHQLRVHLSAIGFPIIGDKLFPPNVYARMIDTIEFENKMSGPRTINDPNGNWTTGEIPAGGSVELTYIQIRGLGNSLNEPNCNGWTNSGGQAGGLEERCSSHRQFELDTGDAPVIEPAIVHMTLTGTLTNAVTWNAYDLVPDT